MQPIIGKRVILFSLEEPDLDFFIKLHREDKNGFMCSYSLMNMTEEQARNYVLTAIALKQIMIFTVISKEGKAARRAGFIYLTNISDSACTISGIMDKDFAKGLAKVLKKGKNTFSADALITLTDWLFKTTPSMARVESDVVETNRTAILLMQKCGYTKEGILRKFLQVNDRRENVVIFSKIREDYDEFK